ncbi:lectin-like domain-containing protein, partial [Staphylococcus lutrae]
MSKKDRELNDRLEKEKKQQRYQAGKLIKSGLKEMKLLNMMGWSGFSHTTSKVDEDKNKKHFVKRNVIKFTTITGGAFTVNMFQNHQAMAASSELPMTSELSAQSETVANQNSTKLTQTSAQGNSATSSQMSVNANSQQNATTQSQLATTDSASTKSEVNSTSNKSETSTSSNTQQSTMNSQNMTTPTTSSDTHQSTVNVPKDSQTTPLQKSTASQSSTNQTSGQALTNQNPSVQNNKTSSPLNITQPLAYAAPANLVATTTAIDSSQQQPTSKLRTFSRLAVNNLAAQPYAALAPSSGQAVVNKDNFLDYFTMSGSATYDKTKGIVTLTPDATSQKGAISLGTIINTNISFNFVGKINLGTRYEGYSPDGVTGGDGIGMAFSPGTLGQVGKAGAALGIGGLNNAFGFKLDTYHNTSQPTSTASANADPASVGGGGAFGAFVTTNSSGVATTYTDSTTTATAAKLKVQPNGTFQDFVIDYNGDTKVMTITYAGQTWTRNISDWIKASNTTDFSLSMTASTGGARNLQQVQIGSFTYTQSAVAQVHYIDSDTGVEIIPPKKLAGDVDSIASVDNQQSTLSSKGYQFVRVDSTYAPAYNATNNTIKMTNAVQDVAIYYKDVTAPTLNVANQTKELNSPITPIAVNSTDNGTGTVTNTVTGLPTGLTYDATTKMITGTPKQLGNYTVSVKAVDQAGNTSTTTFNINVVDTTSPVITVNNQTNQVFSSINNVVISTTDNSGATTDTVTGLPPGLTYNPATKTVSGTPTTIGSYTVTVVSKDASNNTVSKTFTWTIERNSMSDSLSNSASVSTVNSQSVSNSQSLSNQTSQSLSTVKSASTSTSLSESTSASLSRSTSILNSQSTSDSLSQSTSLSMSTSLSVSASGSTSSSLSQSTSTSLSDSTSASESTSKSDSLSKSTSLSESTSKSTSMSDSTSNSLSVSTSTSLSDSTSKSTSLSASTSESTSTSDSTSSSLSQSTSTSLSDSTSVSESTSKSDSLSKSTSLSVSTNESTSTSDSTSSSLSQSTSTSLSDSTSESESKSTSQSTSDSLSTSTSLSMST